MMLMMMMMKDPILLRQSQDFEMLLMQNAPMQEPTMQFEDEEVDLSYDLSTKRTYQPSTLKRKRAHGFLHRISTPGGRRVIRNRLMKGRKYMAV